MSEAENTQTVVDETNTQSTTVTEVNDARNDGDDLDAVLKEFDTAVPAATSKPEPKPNTTTNPQQQQDPALASVQSYIFRKDMDDLVKTVRGELDPEMFDNETVEAWVDGKARKNPSLLQAWISRHSNPEAFERVKTELGKSFVKKFSKMPDRQATEDREAVSAAVRGASNRAPETKAPDFSKLSDNDFQKEKDKLFGT